MAKEKEEVRRLVRHRQRGSPSTSLLYILLLAVNSTDLHKETNAHVAPPVIHSVERIARGEEEEEEEVAEREAFQPIRPFPREERRIFAQTLAKEGGGNRFVAWYAGTKRRVCAARGLCETRAKLWRGAWVGGARKRIEFMTKGNFVSARARPSRLKFN